MFYGTFSTIAISPFWITTELLSVDWKPGCEALCDCKDAILSITQNNVLSSEKVSKQWNFRKYTRMQHRSMLVGYWTEGEPETVTMIVEILGTDPNYAFQRLCDSSPTTALFPIRHSPSQTAYAFNNGTVVEETELTGLCFTVRIAYSKHIKQCPWCASSIKYRSKTEITGNQRFIDRKSAAFPVTKETLIGAALIGFSAILFLTVAAICFIFVYRNSTRPAPTRFPTINSNKRVDNTQWKWHSQTKGNSVFPRIDRSKRASLMSLGIHYDDPQSSSDGYVALPQ
ncbi:unnamed protein product [Enterobius vermicularis]|uniref:Sushi domain-containing protein n=1 Tax=Enterobius vermicularis TaxID=51028 RepID=A0A0N4VI55_ENTVE|nr:unnamed protein product [Enterobius vermicularis]